jgi:pSer/pThr/pTyr-binding forkhead associated (FHA) protein
VLVTDLGSSNGTYVNEEKVKKKLMRAGDVLSVGEFHFFLSYALDS